MSKAVKAVIGLMLAAAIAVGGYYAGYSNHMSSIISAIPKLPANGTETSGNIPDITPIPEKTEQKDGNSEEGKYIGKSASSAADDTWSEIDSCEFDINADNSEEVITLYTSAEEESGEILWNDSQKWVLEVKTSDGYYILLNQNISNGRVYFDVDEISDSSYAITVYTLTSAGKSIKQYTYSKTGFVEKQIFAGESINNLHSGIPMYK